MSDPSKLSIPDASMRSRLLQIASNVTRSAGWIFDVLNDKVVWSDEMCALHELPLGTSPSTVTVFDHHPPEFHELIRKGIDDCIKKGVAFDQELQILTSDGRRVWVRCLGRSIRDESGKTIFIEGALQDITELSIRKELERDLQRVNRALRMSTACSELLIRATDEHDLLTAVCELIVTVGGYDMAYVAFAMDDLERSISPVAHAGDAAYLDDLKMSWSEHLPLGRGPSGRTIRNAAPCFVNDIVQDLGLDQWRERALDHGFHAFVNLPLLEHGRVFGLLALFSNKVLEVGEEEIRLLQRMANDVAFGIGNLRTQAAREHADAMLREQASLLDKAQDAILVRGPDHRVNFWNKGAERLYGFTADEAIGRQVQDLLYNDTEGFLNATAEVLRVGEWNGELIHRRKDGSLLMAECRWTKVVDEKTQAASILAINTDISQKKAAAREIEQLAFYDQLTGLPNRQLLAERLQEMKARNAETRMVGALLFIDLDNFKTLNDTLGHAKGDWLLQQVSALLLKCVREQDTVARFGGDEFVISLVDLDADVEIARRKARIVGEKILDAMRQPFHLADHEHHGTCSIGISLLQDANDTVDDLMKRADLAMYRAKSAGRNMLEIFTPDMQIALNRRAEFEFDLRRAILQDEFLLHYQPQLDRYGRVTGAEALVRWQHPLQGLVSPVDFISLAEESGLIHPLGKWVLESACLQQVIWSRQSRHLAPIVSVNVSAQQFRHPDFVDLVLDVVKRTEIDPRHLKLELTESLLVDDVEGAIAKMTVLKSKGIGFALDDFGTGYSSLSYLKRLPLDELKIDQSFVRDVLTDLNDAAIVRTIVALAESLALSVIAEGVETIAQRDFLARHGCHDCQGFLFSRPLSAVEFECFFLENVNRGRIA
jgi:diguanylate cyclase (GGDEF)-like protein/PAS domain S-box-containing protein